MNGNVSPLQKARFSYQPKLPAALRAGAAVKCIEGEKLQAFADVEKINALFPTTSNMPVLSFEKADAKADMKPINVGVILSGGQVTEPDVPEGGKVLAGTNVFTKISGKAESTVENLNEIFDKLSKILSEENATHIENTLRNLERASANTSKLTQNAERPLREIEASAASLHKILGDVEKAELAQKLEKVLLLVQAKIQEIDTKSINEDLVSTLASIRSFMERTDLFLYNTQSDVSEILNRLNAVLSNLSEFSQKIRQNPSALIRSEKKSGR